MELKEFTPVDGEMYYRGSYGVFARAISKNGAKEELERIHNLSCGDNNISLYRLLRRQGYYSPNMGKDAANTQKDCTKCQESIDVN